MTEIEAELILEGETLLARRDELERTIAREHRGTVAALAVQAAQLGRQRDRLREELRRLVEEVDEAAASRADERDPGYDEEDGPEDFYAARERLAARDRGLVAGIEELQQRARGLRGARVVPALVELERQREQVEGQLRHWRGRCRRLGVAVTLPRHDEYAGGSPED